MLTQHAAVASRQDLFILTNSHMLLEEDSRLIVSEDSGSVEGLFFVALVCGGEGGGARKKSLCALAQMEYLTHMNEEGLFFDECLP